ncbi:cytochrome P450 [Gordonia sp. DT218]|uniref:cytochrome P450 n=1 Tax=Gordonia sp. DT218 TaxID=3416659 RepID=UPI003CF724E1
MEGAEHRRIRKIVAPAFTPRRIQRWNDVLEVIVTDLLDTMVAQGSPADVVSALCLPYPTRVMCRVLDIPEGDSHRFAEWSNAFVSSIALTGEQRTELILEFAEYIAHLLTRKRAQPGGGLIDDLIGACDGGDYLDDSELIGLIISLIAAGTDTTASVLARFLLTLLSDDRRAWTQLVARPELVPNAVNELLRLLVMGPSAALRLATEDVELPSGRISAGEAVAIATSSAMRDESIYRDPHRVDFERSAPPPTLVFGKGAHACLGMNLARSELTIALRELTHRFPDLALATPVSDLQFTDGEVLHSLTALPLTW